MEGDGDGVIASTATTEPPLAHANAAHAAMAAEPQQHPDSGAPVARPQSTVAGLAKEAAQLFHARSYQGCLLILHQLQLHNDEDPKVGQSPPMCVDQGASWVAALPLEVKCVFSSTAPELALVWVFRFLPFPRWVCDHSAHT
jgi:hypothetical protein